MSDMCPYGKCSLRGVCVCVDNACANAGEVLVTNSIRGVLGEYSLKLGWIGNIGLSFLIAGFLFRRLPVGGEVLAQAGEVRMQERCLCGGDVLIRRRGACREGRCL